MTHVATFSGNTRRELAVTGLLVAVLLVSLVPALQHARRERRDGIRRQELIALKSQMEQINNEQGGYPIALAAGSHQFAVLERTGEFATAWYLRTAVENAAPPHAAFDFEHNVYYQYTVEAMTTYFYICGGTYTCGVTREE